MIIYLGSLVVKHVVYEEIRRFALTTGKEYVKSKCLKSVSYHKMKHNFRYYTGYDF